MRAVVVAIVASGLLAAPGPARAADDNKDLIVGLWEIAFSDAPDVPAGTRLEFTKDGKVKMTIKSDGKETTADDSYKVEKDVLTLGAPDGTKNDKGRICLLNKTSLVLHDELEDKVIVLKRIKGK